MSDRVLEVAGMRLLEAAVDGTVDVVLLRPGRLGSHELDADVLRRDGSRLAGLPVFAGPDDPRARQLRGTLPRPVSDLAGSVQEAWFDAAYTERDDQRRGFSRGAVLGRLALTDAWAEKARRLPGAIRVHANLAVETGRARGGGVLVEALSGDPEASSFELTTRSRTGGRVMALQEAEMSDGKMTLAEALATPEVRRYIRGLAEPYRPQTSAERPPSARQTFRERLVSGEMHREAEPRDLTSDGQRRREALHEELVTGRHASSPAARRVLEAARDAEPALPASFGGEGSDWGDALRAQGLDPARFGGRA
jgi:hypothetical protein